MTNRNKGVYAALAARRQHIKALVLAAGLVGRSPASLQAELKLSDAVVWNNLRALADRGEIESSHKGGHTTKWGAPGIRAAYAAERERAARRNASKMALRAERQKIAKWNLPKADAHDFERNSVKRIIDASKAPPIRMMVPNSVWQLGHIGHAGGK